jgi:hypothetical protein
MNNIKSYLQIAKLYLGIKWEMFKMQVKKIIEDERSK